MSGFCLRYSLMNFLSFFDLIQIIVNGINRIMAATEMNGDNMIYKNIVLINFMIVITLG